MALNQGGGGVKLTPMLDPIPAYRIPEAQAIASGKHDLAATFGFVATDLDSTTAFYEHPDGSSLSFYRDDSWTHQDSQGRVTWGRGQWELGRLLWQRNGEWCGSMEGEGTPSFGKNAARSVATPTNCGFPNSVRHRYFLSSSLPNRNKASVWRFAFIKIVKFLDLMI